MLKKTTIAVLGLAASGFVSAGTMGPVCTPGNVTVPCEARMWELGAEALYLRSTFGPVKSYQLAPVTTAPIQDVRNDWDWGYRLMGSYYFNTGNDVTVNWMHFSSTADATILGPLTLPVIGTLLVPGAYSNRDRLDQVNVVMGQHVDFSMRDHARFYGGMQYANIQSQAQTYLTSPVLPIPIVVPEFNIFNNTSFKGFGPTIGIDYSYDIYNGLSLTANGSGSLLYGTERYHQGYVVTDLNAIVAQASARKRSIVPSIEAKLGVNYAYNMAQGVVSIDAGYQVVNYFNALTAQPFQILGTPVRSADYGLYGPYFGLKYIGNV